MDRTIHNSSYVEPYIDRTIHIASYVDVAGGLGGSQGGRGGWGTAAAATAATAASQQLSHLDHHAQGPNIRFGVNPSLRCIFTRGLRPLEPPHTGRPLASTIC